MIVSVNEPSLIQLNILNQVKMYFQDQLTLNCVSQKKKKKSKVKSSGKLFKQTIHLKLSLLKYSGSNW